MLRAKIARNDVAVKLLTSDKDGANLSPKWLFPTIASKTNGAKYCAFFVNEKVWPPMHRIGDL